MFRRLFARFNALFTPDWLIIIEITLMSVMFIQALRYLVGLLYSHIASASLLTVYRATLPADAIDLNAAGVVDPTLLTQELALLGVIIGLPILTILLGRVRFLFVVVAALIAAGRYMMIWPDAPITPLMATILTVAGGMTYIALMIYNRAQWLPYFFILGFALDQLFRAAGDTLDPSWSVAYADTQLIVSVAAVVITLAGLFISNRPNKDDEQRTRGERATVDPNHGIMSLWGGISLGAMLFLQLSLLALPNAIAGRADTDYTTLVPFVIAATLLPIVPAVRRRARHLIAPFESTTRGWIWLIIVALLLVVGLRVPTVAIGGLGFFSLGAVALVAAQVCMSLVWWWLTRPQAERERNFSGLWLIFSVLVFALFVVLDIFTYEYAFVRNFAPPLDTLNSVVPAFLRGLRGLGIGVILVAAFLCILPMIQTTRRIPWTTRNPYSLPLLVVVAAVAGLGAWYARPPIITQPLLDTEMRVGTYNIHGGYTEFFALDLTGIVNAIDQSGSHVVLLQEVERGRLTSFGVDQTLWLARQLAARGKGMDTRFYATNEGLQGLAVLSRFPIVFDDGVPLVSLDQQTGLQRVQIRPDEGAVTLYNTSLGLLLQGESIEEQERNQRQQLNQIFGIIDRHIDTDYGGQLGRTILGGTFHNVPDSPLIDLLRQTGFNDPFAGANIDLNYTLIRTDRRARIDYLWLWAQSLTDIGTGVILNNDASDHRLAFVGVQLRR